jgi:hypothetical protein
LADFEGDTATSCAAPSAASPFRSRGNSTLTVVAALIESEGELLVRQRHRSGPIDRSRRAPNLIHRILVGIISAEERDMPAWRQIQNEYQLENDGEHVPYDQRYWTAQICLAGHVQNGGTRVIPAEKYCGDCGAETIHQCPSCNSNIKGAFRSYGDWIKNPPMCCLKCGKPYPWTQAAMEKVSQLINESSLSITEKQEAKTDLDSILKNTPEAGSAARRTHGRLVRVGGVLQAAYVDYVVPLVAETLAKVIKAG